MDNRYYIRSSSFFMAVLFTVLCGLTLLMLAYFGYYFARGYFIEGTEATIDTEIKYISMYPEALNTVNRDSSRIYIPFHEDGSPPPEIPPHISRMAEGIIVFKHPTSELTYASKIYTDERGQQTLVGVDITKMEENYNFMMILSFLGIFMVAIVIMVSFTISVFVVRGTNDIAGTAREIMKTGDLSRRIPMRWRWDDLSHMSDTLNMMFDRIEQLMRGVRQVSDNIAHDLRTPLTRIKGSIDVLMYELPDHEAVQKLSDETERMLSTFNALLRISRLESEKQRSHFKPVDLAEVLKDVVEFYEPLAEQKHISLSFSFIPAHITGDRDLLFQAFANILDNAVKYAPESGKILVSLEIRDGRSFIQITDSGAGLPQDDLKRIFERFYRSELSRSTQGTGLGLSLAAAIIDLHDGYIRAENVMHGFSIITVL